MPHSPLYLFFMAFAALVSVAMWLDYFRQIDVFEKEPVFPLLIALCIGGITPYISLYLYQVIDNWGFTENGNFINDALFAILGIGLNEEFCKLLGILFVFRLFKNLINEPIDYFVYAGVTALGFALVENFNYFYNHGITIITSRSFYSVLQHLINSSIIVYGLYRKKLFNKGNVVLNSITGISLAVMSHGLFDFFLIEGFLGYFTSFLSLFIYLVGINFWIQMLNNANNYSPFFDYHKINFSPRLVYRLFYWYALTLLIAFINNFIIAGFRFSIINIIQGLLSDGLLFWLVILRVSRFKIYRMKYFKVVPALPFYITKNNDEDFRVPFLNIAVKIRGENYHEHLLTKYLDREVVLHPADYQKTLIKNTITSLITNKYILFDEVIVYTVQLKIPNLYAENDVYVLKPKTSGRSPLGHQYPIAGLYVVHNLNERKQLASVKHQQLRFIEWVYLEVDN